MSVQIESAALDAAAPPQGHVGIRHLPHTALSLAFDRAIRAVGSAVSWIWMVLLLVVVANVVMRYVFGQGRIEFEEIQWHLYSIGFLVGLSYALEADDHVRIDLLYEKFGLKAKAWIEFIGILVFLVPFIVVVVVYAIPFVAYSIGINEVSEAPGGLPARWAIKSVLLIGFALLAIATLSRLSRCTAFLFGMPGARNAPAEG
jgi:TRAP-type mannitol/chloroaromatic compound transport system permease small subunit